MRISVEPKEFFMYSVFLAFSQAQPEPEDEGVKAYLAERDLEPKTRGTTTWEDGEYDVMYFGGCYLGSHLNAIEDIQRSAVEREMLAEEVERTLREAQDPPTVSAVQGASESRLAEIVDGLVGEFHQESSFGADEEGNLIVSLGPEAIRRRFLEFASEKT